MLGNIIFLLLGIGLLASPFFLGTNWYSIIVFIGGLVLYSLVLIKITEDEIGL
jgi:ABC-type transport system involved in Fe-S cluster assembly fused permease/ATPase subunit